jgi:ribosomal protein S2
LVLLFVNGSWQQKDPLNDFCRRFGHQSAVVDRKLYLDGGLVNWNPISQNNANYSSKLFLSALLQTRVASLDKVANVSLYRYMAAL